MSTDRKPAAASTARRTKTGTTGTAKPPTPKPVASRATKPAVSSPDSKNDRAAQSAPAETADSTTTDRAEEVLDEIGQRIGVFALVARDRVLRLTARAREEAEDIWAEAQHLRGHK